MLKDFLLKEFNIEKKVLDLVNEAENSLKEQFYRLDEIAQLNQYKVLKAFQENRINDTHFNWNTGYGYDDMGRDAIEKVYASIFNTESALVRTQIVNGTHALAITLQGILRPKDEVVYCSGSPYDTLEEVIGVRGQEMGSLKDFEILYDTVDLLPDGSLDYDAIGRRMNEKVTMACLQRSTGYSWRKAFSIDEIKKWVDTVKSVDPNIICMVDNCYGEFLDIFEPTDVGVDVMAGSLIKNPGGGLALSGGYVVGKKKLIDKISYRLTCPGIGGDCGLMFGQSRSILQGIFMAPTVSVSAAKGAVLCAKVYENLGFEVLPLPYDNRNDIIQSIKFNDPKLMKGFCQGIQKAAPIDAYVTPEPWEMPGYNDEVIMAAGAFVQGSSIELSADGPMRDPYIAYFQGGITYPHAKFGVIKSADELCKKSLIKL